MVPVAVHLQARLADSGVQPVVPLVIGHFIHQIQRLTHLIRQALRRQQRLRHALEIVIIARAGRRQRQRLAVAVEPAEKPPQQFPADPLQHTNLRKPLEPHHRHTASTHSTTIPPHHLRTAKGIPAKPAPRSARDTTPSTSLAGRAFAGGKPCSVGFGSPHGNK